MGSMKKLLEETAQELGLDDISDPRVLALAEIKLQEQITRIVEYGQTQIMEVSNG